MLNSCTLSFSKEYFHIGQTVQPSQRRLKAQGRWCSGV